MSAGEYGQPSCGPFVHPGWDSGPLLPYSRKKAGKDGIGIAKSASKCAEDRKRFLRVIGAISVKRTAPLAGDGKCTSAIAEDESASEVTVEGTSVIDIGLTKHDH